MTITKTVIGVDVGSGSVRAGILISTDLCYPMPQKNHDYAAQRKPRGTVQPGDLAGGLFMYS